MQCESLAGMRDKICTQSHPDLDFRVRIRFKIRARFTSRFKSYSKYKG